MQGESITDTRMTVKDASNHFSKSVDAIKKRLQRQFKLEKEPSTKEFLTNEQIQFLKKCYDDAATPKVTNPKTKSTSKNAIQGFSISKMTEFDMINFLEMGLIIFGLFQLFNIPGIILALMACLFIFKAQSIAKNPKLKKTIQKSLQVVFWMAFASFFLHFVTFYRNIPQFDFPPKTNPFITTVVPLLIAFLPALFTSILNYKSISTTASISKKE